MAVSNEDLYNSLSELQVIPKLKLDEALELARKSKTSLENVLMDKDLISEANLGEVKADLLSLPFVKLSETIIKDSVLNLLPKIYAIKQKVVVFNKDEKGLHVAIANPEDKQTLEFIKKKTGENVIPYYVGKRDLENALILYEKDVKRAFDEIIEENVIRAKGTTKKEPSIIKIVDTTVKYAYQNKASDIHIEPVEENSLIRFRIDGILHDIIRLPVELHPRIVTRIKVLAKLRTDEHFGAQDGKISYELDNEDLDIRVSVVPITDGEKIVMRLLSERSRQFSLTDLGLSQDDIKKLKSAYEKPHGMILATGPTGSGKTTTLYAVLKILNRRDVNIMTIEDPVEYDVEGVNQIQVNLKTDLTFAKGLRSIVRQDPDIILVGEIRDEETADISINAALTGHLVLSTLHTNDAATSIPRLLDLKVEPFLVGSTVNVIVAQRLVRKICESCRVSEEVEDIKERFEVFSQESGESRSERLAIIDKYFGGTDKVRVYKGKGCSVCHQTGYFGRIGIFEVLIIEDKIRQAILEKKDAASIRKISQAEGMTTMVEDGFNKVKQGLTTVEEVLRVTKE